MMMMMLMMMMMMLMMMREKEEAGDTLDEKSNNPNLKGGEKSQSTIYRGGCT